MGKPVMQHGSTVEQETEQLRRHGYKSWKEYLLTVSECSQSCYILPLPIDPTGIC